MSEKETARTEAAVESPPHTSSDAHYASEEPTGDVALPPGWMYRHRKIAGINIPWYASPKIQLGMVAFVCFLCPGMFNALSGMGGGGKTDATLADNMVSSTPLSIHPNRKPNSLRNRTPPFTLLSLFSVSLEEHSSTGLVLNGRWHSVESDTVFTPSPCSFPFTPVSEASTSLRARFLASAQVYYGLPRAPS